MKPSKLMMSVLSAVLAVAAANVYAEDEKKNDAPQLQQSQQILAEGDKKEGEKADLIAEGDKKEGEKADLIAEGDKKEGEKADLIAEGDKKEGEKADLIA
jgi:hypothetical protein